MNKIFLKDVEYIRGRKEMGGAFITYLPEIPEICGAIEAYDASVNKKGSS
jgi:hypothetical protein